MKQEHNHEHAGIGDETLNQLDRSKKVIGVPEGYFEAKAVLLVSAMCDQFNTPEDYFENRAKQLESALDWEEPDQQKGRVVRIWWATAAAVAVLVGIGYIVVADNEQALSFAAQLEQAQLDYEDLEELDLDEALLEELVVMDTIVPDTIVINKLPDSVEEFKPADGQRVITWDDITNEDIEEYLKEEESLNIIDEI